MATFLSYVRPVWLGAVGLAAVLTAGCLATQTTDDPASVPAAPAQQAPIQQAPVQQMPDLSNVQVAPTGETGLRTPEGYPVVTLPPDADPTDENWNGIDLSPKPPVLPLSPEEERQRLMLPEGYDLELILSEPDVQEPAAISFDGNGRMYVLELRGYMQDADATGETDPVGRISRHEDRDNDGVYEHHTVFIDNLVFPRFVMPFGKDAVLSMESHQDNVYKFTDTNGDGVADRKEFFAGNFGRNGNVEHQQSFLTWSMDNWLYATYQPVRLRWTPGAVLREPTGSPGGAWGITQDNYGKTWVQAGASGVPGYYQFPIVYGNFSAEGQLEEGFRVPWGAPVLIADMQGGMDQVRMPDGSLNSTTAGAGNDIFRGHRLPAELSGDYFYGEVVARIVRRVRPEVREGLTYLRNVYQPQQSEFIRSTDPLFRPVDMATAPDGTMYIVDMYRGIIQQGTWSNPGSYLRAKVEQYQLDEVVRHGRIWRLTYNGMERDRTQPRMLDETPAQLVRHLEHPNGWWRDTAQQLLVLSQDRSVVPALQTMARTSGNELARIHALWTLEGLGALSADMARELMKDANPRIRLQALRASETLYKMGDKSLEADYRTLTNDANTDVAIQAMLTLNVLDVPDIESVVRSMQAAHTAQGIQQVGAQILENIAEEQELASSAYTPWQQTLLGNGASIYAQLCSECHGDTGLGTPQADGTTIAPALAGSPRVLAHSDYITKVLLHGMSGPIEGRSYPGDVMISMGSNPDVWIAAVASYVRNSFGNEGTFVTPEYVAKVRALTAGRSAPYRYEELMATVPQVLTSGSDWTITASHGEATRIGNSGSAGAAFTFEGWTTGVAQQPGMWFQVEMPRAARIMEIQFESPPRSQGRGDDAPPPLSTAPQAYSVQVSMDGNAWSTVAEGRGEGDFSTITFEPVQARFVRILQSGQTETAPWSMQQMKLFALN
jgi:mono/diheme cytochrome c family protein/glucose/arabinose dehydrogenase